MSEKIILFCLLFVALLVFMYHRFSVPNVSVSVPEWSQNYFEFYTEADDITLSFSYDYTSLNYRPDQISFYVGLWECLEGVCPRITGDPRSNQPFSPSPRLVQHFSGDDSSHIQDDSTLTISYTVSVSPSEYWKPGNYVAYIIAVLTDSTSVRSDPSLPADITIEAPSGPPPTPIILSPKEDSYYSWNGQSSIVFEWSVDDTAYYGLYTYVFQIDNTTFSPSVSVENTVYSKGTTSSSVSLQPGNYLFSLKTVSSDGDRESEVSTVSFHVKLPSPTDVNTYPS